MKLIVGLGNPGEKYERNRHNVGFAALDILFEDYEFQPWRKKFSGLVAEGRIGREKCLMLKPLTYMNESGRSVGEALRFYKLDLKDIIVIYDEIDLAPGKIKIKTGGGNAGHNGLRSLSAHIDNDYMRLRIGVGRPPQKGDVANYVLRDFSKTDRTWLEPLLETISRYMGDLFEKGAPVFLKEVADRLAPPKQEVRTENPSSARAKENPKDQDRTKKPENKQDDRESGPLARALNMWKKTRESGE